MSFSSELKEWGVAVKELFREEKKKHPYLHWIVAGLIFFYFIAHYFLDRAN
jgi:hypothetical protein